MTANTNLNFPFKVRCIDARTFKNGQLTKGAVYTVLDNPDGFYQLQECDGLWIQDRFEILPESIFKIGDKVWFKDNTNPEHPGYEIKEIFTNTKGEEFFCFSPDSPYLNVKRQEDFVSFNPALEGEKQKIKEQIKSLQERLDSLGD